MPEIPVNWGIYLGSGWTEETQMSPPRLQQAVVMGKFSPVRFNVFQDVDTQHSIPVRSRLQITDGSFVKVESGKLSEKPGAEGCIWLNRSQPLDFRRRPKFRSELSNACANLEDISA